MFHSFGSYEQVPKEWNGTARLCEFTHSSGPPPAAEMHFVVAIDLRMRAENMPRQTGEGAHVAQQEDSGVGVRRSAHRFNSL